MFGAGADSIFLYIGNKTLNLPDLEHAIDLDDIADVVAKINICFTSMKKSENTPKSVKIDFIG